MNTIQRSLSVLHGIALAGLGAATLCAAAPAQATIDASHATGLEVTRAARGSVSRQLSATGQARLVTPVQSLAEPILVAPDCPSCFWRQEPAAIQRATEALLVAPCPGGCEMTEPALVAVGGGCGNACGWGGPLAFKATQQRAETPALPAPILVAPTGCNRGCRPAVVPVDIRIVPAPLLLAGGDPPTVIDSVPWWRRLWA